MPSPLSESSVHAEEHHHSLGSGFSNSTTMAGCAPQQSPTCNCADEDVFHDNMLDPPHTCQSGGRPLNPPTSNTDTGPNPTDLNDVNIPNTPLGSFPQNTPEGNNTQQNNHTSHASTGGSYVSSSSGSKVTCGGIADSGSHSSIPSENTDCSFDADGVEIEYRSQDDKRGESSGDRMDESFDDNMKNDGARIDVVKAGGNKLKERSGDSPPPLSLSSPKLTSSPHPTHLSINSPSAARGIPPTNACPKLANPTNPNTTNVNVISAQQHQSGQSMQQQNIQSPGHESHFNHQSHRTQGVSHEGVPEENEPNRSERQGFYFIVKASYPTAWYHNNKEHKHLMSDGIPLYEKIARTTYEIVSPRNGFVSYDEAVKEARKVRNHNAWFEGACAPTLEDIRDEMGGNDCGNDLDESMNEMLCHEDQYLFGQWDQPPWDSIELEEYSRNSEVIIDVMSTLKYQMKLKEQNEVKNALRKDKVRRFKELVHMQEYRMRVECSGVSAFYSYPTGRSWWDRKADMEVKESWDSRDDVSRKIRPDAGELRSLMYQGCKYGGFGRFLLSCHDTSALEDRTNEEDELNPVDFEGAVIDPEDILLVNVLRHLQACESLEELFLQMNTEQPPPEVIASLQNPEAGNSHPLFCSKSNSLSQTPSNKSFEEECSNSSHPQHNTNSPHLSTSQNLCPNDIPLTPTRNQSAGNREESSLQQNNQPTCSPALPSHQHLERQSRSSTTPKCTQISKSFFLKVLYVAPQITHLKVLSFGPSITLLPDALGVIGKCLLLLERLDIAHALSQDYIPKTANGCNSGGYPYEKPLVKCVDSLRHLTRLDLGDRSFFDESQKSKHRLITLLIPSSTLNHIKETLHSRGGSVTEDQVTMPPKFTSEKEALNGRWRVFHGIANARQVEIDFRNMALKEMKRLENIVVMNAERKHHNEHSQLQQQSHPNLTIQGQNLQPCLHQDSRQGNGDKNGRMAATVEENPIDSHRLEQCSLPGRGQQQVYHVRSGQESKHMMGTNIAREGSKDNESENSYENSIESDLNASRDGTNPSTTNINHHKRSIGENIEIDRTKLKVRRCP